MGKRGPRPTPSAVKELRGTYRKDKAAAAEVRPDPEIPEPPDGMSPEALAEWEYIAPKLVKYKLLTELDRAALEMRCEAVAIARRAAKAARDGVSVETGAGGEKTSPAVRTFKDYAALVRQLDAEFGLTPAARTRVSPTAPKVEGEEEPADPLEALIRANQERLRSAGVRTN